MSDKWVVKYCLRTIDCNSCPLYKVAGLSTIQGLELEGQSVLSELSVISWVSAVEGCPLSGVPL